MQPERKKSPEYPHFRGFLLFQCYRANARERKGSAFELTWLHYSNIKSSIRQKFVSKMMLLIAYVVKISSDTNKSHKSCFRHLVTLTSIT